MAVERTRKDARADEGTLINSNTGSRMGGLYHVFLYQRLSNRIHLVTFGPIGIDQPLLRTMLLHICQPNPKKTPGLLPSSTQSSRY